MEELEVIHNVADEVGIEVEVEVEREETGEKSWPLFTINHYDEALDRRWEKELLKQGIPKNVFETIAREKVRMLKSEAESGTGGL